MKSFLNKRLMAAIDDDQHAGGSAANADEPSMSVLLNDEEPPITEYEDVIEDVMQPAKKVGSFAAIAGLMGFGGKSNEDIDAPALSTVSASAYMTGDQLNKVAGSKKKDSKSASKQMVQYSLVGAAFVSAISAGFVINSRSNAERHILAAESSLTELDTSARTIGRVSGTAALGDPGSIATLENFVRRTTSNFSNIRAVESKVDLKEFSVIAASSKLILDKKKSLEGVEDSLNTIINKSELIKAYAEQLQAIILQKAPSSEAIFAANKVQTVASKIRTRIEDVMSGKSPEKSIRAFNEDVYSILEHVNDIERMNVAADADVSGRLQLLKAATGRMSEVATKVRANLGAISEAKAASVEIGLSADLASKTIPDIQKSIAEGRQNLSSYQLIAAILALLAVGLIAAIFSMSARNEKQRAKQIEADKIKTEDAIERMLMEIVPISNGDLTARITVTDDVTGVIADAVNLTIDELNRLVIDINKSADGVTKLTGKFADTMTQIAGAVTEQEVEVKDANSSMSNLTESIRHIATSAEESYGVAQESLQAANGGVEAVQKTIEGMHNIRGDINETSKRVKRLGESSQEIGEIADVILEITNKTNILALNAFVQAAGAGEQGRGFRVIAQEIQELAKRSDESLGRVTGLIQTIQTDMQEAIAAMERSTHGVIEGTELADSAGAVLNRIQGISEQMAELVAGISNAAHNQEEDAGEVTERMVKILAISQKSSVIATESKESVDKIGDTVNGLSRSVAGFTVA